MRKYHFGFAFIAATLPLFFVLPNALHADDPDIGVKAVGSVDTVHRAKLGVSLL